MFRTNKITLLFLSFLLALTPLSAADLKKANDLLKQIDAKLQPESYQSYRKLINIEPDGTKKEFVLYTLKKGSSKVVSLFLSPASDNGRSTLRLDENMWLYIPGIARPLRITSVQSVTGGVFNNADILRLDFSVEYEAIGLKESDTEYELKLKAKNDSVAYMFLTMQVDKKSLTPLKIDCLANEEMLIKTITYSKIQDFGGGIVRPSIVETTSPLQKGYKSVMVFGKIKTRELKDEYFTQEFLSKVSTIRE
jgi:hypothetical protein